ncbi:D-Ala-D-Ala carboxypeptidase family metallohydrolase [Myxosarcina sp. GI1(2024)]
MLVQAHQMVGFLLFTVQCDRGDMIKYARGGKFNLPGYQSTFEMSELIGGKGYFTWAEALKFSSNGSYRAPDSKTEVDNILRQASRLSAFREYFGAPLIVTSWYRPPAVNRQVGGSTRSMHLTGLATDVIARGVSGHQIANKAREFGWVGGIAASARHNFCHLDLGRPRTWSY